ASYAQRTASPASCASPASTLVSSGMLPQSSMRPSIWMSPGPASVHRSSLCGSALAGRVPSVIKAKRTRGRFKSEPGGIEALRAGAAGVLQRRRRREDGLVGIAEGAVDGVGRLAGREPLHHRNVLRMIGEPVHRDREGGVGQALDDVAVLVVVLAKAIRRQPP